MKTKNTVPRKKIGFKSYDSEEGKTETSRKKIGFKSYDESASTAENTNNSLQETQIPMSVAQADLVESINNLAAIIVSKQFANFADQQRVNLVMQFMNSVAINAELTTKTMLLVG